MQHTTAALLAASLGHRLFVFSPDLVGRRRRPYAAVRTARKTSCKVWTDDVAWLADRHDSKCLKMTKAWPDRSA